MDKNPDVSIETPSTFSQAFAGLVEIRGDLLSAILFLPVAITFQNLVENLTTINDWYKISIVFWQTFEIFIVLIFFILEVLALSVIFCYWGNYSALRKVNGLVLGGLFMIAITTMGFASEIKDVDEFVLPYLKRLFRAALVISIMAGAGGLFLMELEEEIDRSDIAKITAVLFLFLLLPAIGYMPRIYKNLLAF